MKKRLLTFLLAAALLLPASARAAEPEIVASNQALLVDGAAAACEKYNIDGYNYFKLRDIAMLLRDSAARFAVDYDAQRNAVVVTTGLPYTPNGSELAVGPDLSAKGVPSAQSVWIDGVERRDLSAWNFGGHNFFRLRDLGQALGFDVDYDAASRAARIESGGAAAELGAAYLALRQWTRRSYNAFTADTGDPVYWRKAPFGNGVWRRCGVSSGDDGALRLHFHGFTAAQGEIYVTLNLTPGGTVHRATLQYYSSPFLTAVPFYGEADVDAQTFTADSALTFDVVRGWPEDTGEKDNMARLLCRGVVEALNLAQTLLTEETAPGLGVTIGDFGFDAAILTQKNTSPRVTSDLARPLRLYSHDGSVFLGVVAHDDRNSVWNATSFGNPENERSIMNERGRYGSDTSDESPFNPYATAPPLLRDQNGGFVCYVSMNEGYPGAYTLREINAFLRELGE